MAKNAGKQKGIQIGSAVLVLLLLVQALALVYIASHKGGMHTDEYYSYILSNSYDADCIADDSTMWAGGWMAGILRSFSRWRTENASPMVECITTTHWMRIRRSIIFCCTQCVLLFRGVIRRGLASG